MPLVLRSGRSGKTPGTSVGIAIVSAIPDAGIGDGFALTVFASVEEPAFAAGLQSGSPGAGSAYQRAFLPVGRR